MNTTDKEAVTDSRKVASEKRTILTCDGVFRKQAFRRGSHIIGYGKTEQEAIADMQRKLKKH